MSTNKRAKKKARAQIGHIRNDAAGKPSGRRSIATDQVVSTVAEFHD
jgi:hypothetical protein